MTQKLIGFIGLGEMGKPMARNLAKSGFPLTVFDLLRQPVEEIVKLGGKGASSSRELAGMCDVIITMVRDTPSTEEVIFGNNGIWEGIKDKAILIIMSTIDPIYCQELTARTREKNTYVLDAPVSGAPEGAEAGTLSIFVGGEKKVFEDCLPIFGAMGKNFYYMGGSGMGEVTKILNNMLLFITTAGIKEGLALAKKAGIDEELFREVVKTSSGNSWAIQTWGNPLSPGMVALAYKDLHLALDLAESLGIRIPVTGVTYQTDLSH